MMPFSIDKPVKFKKIKLKEQCECWSCQHWDNPMFNTTGVTTSDTGVKFGTREEFSKAIGHDHAMTAIPQKTGGLRRISYILGNQDYVSHTPERAPTGNSHCKLCRRQIPKGAVRIVKLKAWQGRKAYRFSSLVCMRCYIL